MSGISATVTRVKINSERILRAHRELSNLAVKVGYPSGGSLQIDKGVTVAQKAIYNEYGSNNGRVPPRPFMRQTVELTKTELEQLKAGLLMRVSRGMSPEVAMGVLGEWYSAQIKATITRKGKFTPLAPRTIARKGDDKPLIETSQMLNAVTYKVIRA